MTATQPPHVVIVGGGIAGLSAAWRLQERTRESGGEVRITLLEASDRAGGKLHTEQCDGLTIEAGPDSLLSYKPAALNLARELGIEDRVINTRDTGGGTYILRDGRLEPLPEGITMMVPTKVRPLLRSRLLSMRGKLRMAAEYMVPPREGEDDESVGAFITRRLGREAYQHMAQPLLSGIFAGDANQLSLAATFPRLRDIEREHGGLVKGMLAQRKAQTRQEPSGGWTPGGSYSPFVSFAGGMGELVDSLVNVLTGVNLRLGTAAERLWYAGDRYQIALSTGEVIVADGVMLATPAYVSADLVEPLDGELAALLRRIPYVSSATINLAFNTNDLPVQQAGRGFVIPHVENRELTAVTWASNKFAGRAPDDQTLLRTFVGRAGREEAVEYSDDVLLGIVRRELYEVLGIDTTPAMVRIYRWRRAMPQYVLGHLERVERIEASVRQHRGIQVMGNAYRGVGIPDCIASGYQAADATVAELQPGLDSA